MRRRSIECRREHPRGECRGDGKRRRNGRLSDYQMVGRARNGEAVRQPKNASITLFNLGLVLVVRFKMSMRHGVRVVRVGLMDVRRRDGDKRHHPRHKRENEGTAPD